jgi:hypothetical protein
LYFILSISKDSAEVLGKLTENFNTLLKDFSFNLQEYIFLKDNSTNSVYYLKDFVYPRLYASTSSTSVLLCFKEKELVNKNDLTIYIKDFVNNSGDKLKFNFSKKDIDNTPSLKL